jgi:methanobactin biosynthesis MbnP-like protein
VNKNQLLLIAISLILFSCQDKNSEEPIASKQSINLNFAHRVDGQAAQFDTMRYENPAGNPYLINEIQWFISDLTLIKTNGDSILIDGWKDIHYIDTDLSETQTWKVYDNLPVGDYQEVRFTFGFTEEKNQSFMYVNPPERDMFWPEFLGGGYHYMKLNGKWKEPNGNITPFDFHMGIGQIYHSYPDSIIGFVQNYFRVTLPNSSFSLAKNESKNLHLIMNIENWFQNPNLYDHNIWKGYIMQNQEAMQLARENGRDVFSLEIN